MKKTRKDKCIQTRTTTTYRIIGHPVYLCEEMEKSARSAFSGSSNSSAYCNDNARTNCGRRNGNCGFVIGGDLDERKGKERKGKERKVRKRRKKERNWKRGPDRQTDRQNTEGRFVDLGRRRRRRRRRREKR